MYHLSAVDEHCGIALDNAGPGVVGVRRAIVIRIVLVRAATAAIDVATQGVRCAAINAGVGDANSTAMDDDLGVLVGVAVLAAAVDGALDMRGPSSLIGLIGPIGLIGFIGLLILELGCRQSDGDVSIVHPCQIVVGVAGRLTRGLCHIAARRAEHHAVLLAVCADGSARDGDFGIARIDRTDCSACVFVVRVGAHRTVGTATIYVMQDFTAGDDDVCVTLYKSELGVAAVAEATAIDVAVCSFALACCADDAAADVDMGVAAHLRQLAATVDALEHRAASYLHRRAAGHQGRIGIVGLTLACAEDVAGNACALHGLLLLIALGNGSAHVGPHLDGAFRADVHPCVAHDVCLLAAAIDIGDVAQGILISVFARCVVAVDALGIFACNHVDVHRRTAIHHGSRTEAAAEHAAQVLAGGLADAGTGDDVQDGVAVELGRGVIRGGGIDGSAVGQGCAGHQRAVHVLLIAIYRVGSLIAAQVECVYLQGVTARFLDGDSDGALDGSGYVVAAEDALEASAGDDEVHAAIHMGVTGTAIDVVHVLHTSQYQRHVAILLGLVAGAVDFLDVALGATAVPAVGTGVGHGDGCAAAHVALRVAAAEYIMYMAAHELRLCLAGAVVRWRAVIVVYTYVCTWVDEGVCALTVTAAKHIVNDVAARHGDVGGRHGCGIAAAIDIFYTGQVAALDDDLGRSFLHKGLVLLHAGVEDGVGRDVVGLVAAAIDRRHVVGGAAVACHIRILRAVHGALHMHLDVSLGRTVPVVRAEDLACQGHAVLALAGIRAYQLCAVEHHGDIAAHEGLHAGHGLHCGHIARVALRANGRCRCHSFPAQAAAEDVAVDGAAIEVDSRGLLAFARRIEGQGIRLGIRSCILCRIGVAQCRAAIDVAVYHSRAAIVGRGIAGLRADVHRDVAIDQRRLALATAKHHVLHGVALARGSHRAAADGHFGIRPQHAVDVGAAVDGRLHQCLRVVGVL